MAGRTIRRPDEIWPQIRECREAKGWTQTELARRLGVAPSYISLIEGGGRPELSVGMLLRLADALQAGWCYDGDRIVFRQTSLTPDP